MNVLLLGFGSVGSAFCNLLKEQEFPLKELLPAGVEVKVVGIGTKTRGCLFSRDGLPLKQILDFESKTGKLIGMDSLYAYPYDSESLVSEGDYDLLVECTTSSMSSRGGVARLIKIALDRGKTVVTCNSAVVYNHYFELKELSEQKGASFIFDSAVIAGVPLFSFMKHCLPCAKVVSCYGVINGTSNYVLEMMEEGSTLDEAIMEAVRKGCAEKDPLLDIEGTDSAVKASIIAQVLMGASFHALEEISIEGIRNVTPEMFRKAKKEGARVKLVAKIQKVLGSVQISVRPEVVPSDNPVSRLRGASKGVIMATDIAGEVYLASDGFGPRQVGYGLLRDVLEYISGKIKT